MDVTVSSLGNAKSLRGGTLLMTPLKGADGQIYAMAQGNLTVGGFGAGGADGSTITVNVPSVGRIPNGATVEREVPSSFAQGDSLVLNLKRSGFHHRQSHVRGHQRELRRRCRPAARRLLGAGARADRSRSACRLRVDDREPDGRDRRAPRARGHQCADRDHRHRLGRQGDAGSGHPRQPDGHHQRESGRCRSRRLQSAGQTAVVPQTDINVEAGQEPDVPLLAGNHAGRDRPGRERCRRGAWRSGRHPRSPARSRLHCAPS